MVSMAEKDLRAALDLAADLGLELPATDLTWQRAPDAIGGPLRVDTEPPGDGTAS